MSITEIRNEMQPPAEIGGKLKSITVIGVYDPELSTRNTYYETEYAILIADIGETIAAELAAHSGWAV